MITLLENRPSATATLPRRPPPARVGRVAMNVSAHPFLEGFTPAARDRLIGCMAQEKHPGGEFLFHEGDPADGVYLVLEGEIEIVLSAGKQEKVLNRIKAGSSLGEVAVLDGMGRSTSARAHGPSSTARIPRSDLLDVLGTEPGTVALKLFRHVMGHLRNANDFIVSEVVHKEKLSLVGEMASSLMHDLRNPVSSIRLGADLINMTYPEQNIGNWCDGIRLQCDRLIAMAMELMEFSKGESKLTLCPTTTIAFLEQFKTLNENYLANTGVKVTFDAKPAQIEIDSMRLQRVLQNLMTNAVEALRSTPKPRLDIKARVKDCAFLLTVKDNGPGIPAAIQSRIFEPFVTHGKSGGIGLGMAVVRNIVTAHGGTITFETSPDHGTAFLVSLPQTSRT
jgi:signal transduction histidine kinase